MQDVRFLVSVSSSLFLSVVSDLLDSDQQFFGGLEHVSAVHRPFIGPL